MAHAHAGVTQPTTKWVGWVVFASIVMITLGAIEVMMAMVAFFNKAYYQVASNDLAVHISYNGWGWIQLGFGVLLLAAGYGLLAGQTWARAVAIVVAFLSAVANMALIAAYPWWALTVIALDIIVIYAVAVHGAEAREISGMH